MRRLVIVAVAMAMAGACGKGGGGSPTAPEAAHVTAISVNGPDVVFLGHTGAYTAAMTGGTAACTWGGDAPQVGTISGTGVLTGTGNGKVTIWCDAAGLRGTRLVQVIATYAGSWIGSYRVTGCTETADFRGLVCGDFPNDRVLPLSGSFTQSNLAATGAFALGQLTAAPVTSTLAPDGTLTFSETHDGTGVITIRSQWQVHQVQDGKITGHVTIVFTAAGFVGSGTIDGEIFNTNRTSALSTDLAGMPIHPSGAFPTLGDVLRGMQR